MMPATSTQVPGLCVAGCKHTTRDFVLGLERHGYRIGHCLTISPETAAAAQVAGFYDLRPFLQAKGIPYTVACKYSLKSEEDRTRLLALGMELLLVIGWQRLIPDWWLNALPRGAFGMHGSSKPLPHGRGRSPMNWSLIQGKTVFYTHLFQYRPGVDDGPIAGVQQFDITPFDTCHTLHLKNMTAMVHLCARLLPGLLGGTAALTAQPKEGASYYPKRAAEDGLLYWTDRTEQIYNLVRAVTRPFPGAFTYLDNRADQKLMIWRGIPFDTRLQWEGAAPGEILEVFYDGSFVVKTGDSTFLVLESEGHAFTESDIGRRLGDLGTPRKVWENLPE
jgi:methionyl-tRNA formyltransferase